MKIYDTEIQPGEHTIVRIPAPKLYNWTPMFLPVHVIRGKKPGPTLCVTAALHGDEVNGVEIIRRLLKKKTLNSLAGTLIAIPVVNIYGFIFQDRYLPDRRDLNRSFPGSEKGSLASRFARLLIQTIFCHVTHCVDIHTGSAQRSNLPQIRVNLESPGVLELAKAFAAPVILSAPHREGSLREYARLHHIPCILYEAGEALRFDETSIRVGVNGILNVMQHLTMLPTSKAVNKEIKPVIARSSYWVRSPYGGIFVDAKPLGADIKKGDVLGVIVHPNESIENEIISPIAGKIIGRSDSPLIHEGAGLFHIACAEKPHNVAEKNAQWLQPLRDSDQEEDKALETRLDG